MCIAERANTWWWDVLRNGSRAAHTRDFFDIDWDAPGLQGRVLLPVLGAPRRRGARGRRTARWSAAPDGGFELHYEGSAFPLAPDTAATVGPVSLETSTRSTTSSNTSRPGPHALNYRRFFDVSSLAGVRVEEDPRLRGWCLTRALELVEDGTVDGLRIDHIDGLRDPGLRLTPALAVHLGHGWSPRRSSPPARSMPVEWPIDGTTGYEFGALMTSLMIHPGGLADTHGLLPAVHR